MITPFPAVEGINYHQWERFNEKAFWFNHDVLDRYVVKPAATVWAKTSPDSVRRNAATWQELRKERGTEREADFLRADPQPCQWWTVGTAL